MQDFGHIPSLGSPDIGGKINIPDEIDSTEDNDLPLLTSENHLSVDDENDTHTTNDSNFKFDFFPTSVKAQAFVFYADQISFFMRGIALAALTDDTGDKTEIGKGLIFTVMLGILLGLLIPPSDSLNNDWYPSFSNILGYTYFVAWSISWYPQIIYNYKEKKTEGLSVDLYILVLFSYIAYTAFNCAMYWSDDIREQYSELHNGGEVLVQSNDVAFSVHALVMSIVTLWQIGYYDGFRKRPASKYTLTFTGSTLIIGCIYAFFILFIGEGFFTWINFLYGLSYLKVIITVIQYIPQAHLNYSRKSTVGWNVWSVVLDFFGGILSLLQLIFDSWNKNDFSGVTGDITKLLLSVVTMFFDILFLVQHYVLYPSEGENDLNVELEQNLLNEDHTPEIVFL